MTGEQLHVLMVICAQGHPCAQTYTHLVRAKRKDAATKQRLINQESRRMTDRRLKREHLSTLWDRDLRVAGPIQQAA
jgi:hypothetical protein